jgi:hypothetical protein
MGLLCGWNPLTNLAGDRILATFVVMPDGQEAAGSRFSAPSRLKTEYRFAPSRL